MDQTIRKKLFKIGLAVFIIFGVLGSLFLFIGSFVKFSGVGYKTN